MKKFFPVIVLFVAAGAFAQNESKAKLVDEFGRLGCEDILARTDNFLIQLRSQDSLTGVVVIHGSGRGLEEYPGRFILHALIGRGGNHLKVKFIRNESAESQHTQFWIGGNGSDLKIQNSRPLYDLPLTISERFRLGRETGDPCTTFLPNGFADILKSNPHLIGQLVVFNADRTERAELAAHLIKTFREEYGLPRERLRIFFKRGKSVSSLPYDTEYWLRPK